MQRSWFVCVVLLSALNPSQPAAAQPSPASDAYWTLLHEEAVVSDLALSARQRQDFQATLDALDLRLFPLRNRSAKEAGEGAEQIVADAKSQMAKVLNARQLARLDKLILRQLGIQALQQESVSKQLALTDKQRAAIDAAIQSAQSALSALQTNAEGKSTEELSQAATKIKTTERDTALVALSETQTKTLTTLIATDFDLGRLGRTRFKVPELSGESSGWRNSPPLSLVELRGKVVVVHFFACGCINCVHNYSIYRKWHAELAGKGVALIGIHTPETKAERDVAHLERKIKEDELAFPVLIDKDSANWNAWGNSMWPSVYVIDKRGYLRHFWAGELNWQGAKGEAITREWIERLLKE